MKALMVVLALALASPAFAQTSSRPVELRGFFAAATEQTEAKETFDAILGTERMTLIGGGGEIVITRRWIVRGQLLQFTDTGTRVFVDTDDTVFGLDIPLDITVRITEFSAGYRFLAKPRWGLYAAAGRSSYSLREESNGETARSSGGGWHVLGGFDVKPIRWVFLAGEAQWTKTDDMLTGGAAEALGESRLGGIRAGARIGFAF